MKLRRLSSRIDTALGVDDQCHMLPGNSERNRRLCATLIQYAIWLCPTKIDQEWVRTVTGDDIGLKILYEPPTSASGATATEGQSSFDPDKHV